MGYYRAIVIASLVAASALAGCARSGPAPAPLPGTSWTLHSYGDAKAPTSVIAGTEVTASFEAENRVSGAAGCNRYFGQFKAAGAKLSISALGSTKMYCPAPDGVMTQEAAFFSAMQKVESYEVRSGELRLLYDGGGSALVFAAQ